jgi:hypothetical protein
VPIKHSPGLHLIHPIRLNSQHIQTPPLDSHTLDRNTEFRINVIDLTMKSKYDKGARVRRQTQQSHRVRTGRITQPGTATPRIRLKKKPNEIPKDLLEMQLSTSSPFVSLSPASIMCRKTLRCGCRKAHITGSAWGMLTATLEQVVKKCRSATYWGALTIERIPDPSHEGGVRVMVRNTDLYSKPTPSFPCQATMDPKRS